MERSHENQVRELIPLYLTANISLRLDVSPYNARCFLPIADRSFNYAMPCRSHSPTNNDGQIPDRSRSLPRDRTGLFLKRVCVSRGTIRQCFRFRVMQRDATKLTATLITRTISRSRRFIPVYGARCNTRFSPPFPPSPPLLRRATMSLMRSCVDNIHRVSANKTVQRCRFFKFSTA